MTRLSFRLPETFLDGYRERPVEWGYTDAAGNSLGEITFLRTYSRKKPCVEHGYLTDKCSHLLSDSAVGVCAEHEACDCLKAKERWYEVCRRVIEGMFSIQKDHAKINHLPWSDKKAQATARDAYERLFTFKWTPPGRGLWIMGTALVHEQRNSAALQNCAFVSTADMTKTDPAGPFAFLMEASMLGIGVGFDTAGAAKRLPVYQPDEDNPTKTVVSDDREGWVASVVELLESYLIEGRPAVYFNTDLVRKEGEPIKTFGGTAAGPEPLERLHKVLRIRLNLYAAVRSVRVATDSFGDAGFQIAPARLASLDGTVDTALIADIGNLIGVCVVSGNVRRSAELLLGSLSDPDFLGLKDPAKFPERNAYPGGWGWMSNNSVTAEVGQDLGPVAEGIALNGEPGIVWMDLSRSHGRLVDPPNNKDWRAKGYNPCAEQTLESYECCTLVETYIGRHESLEDYKKTLKVAYLYGKTVTLLPTHWERTNAIMQRNRRIGTSMSGIADFYDRHGLTALREWMDQGYLEVQRLDKVYSEWLCVRESIKTTTVKPSGTVSILAGVSPGVHWGPGGEYFDRAIRFSKGDPMVTMFRWAGYRVEDDVSNAETTVVVFFPIKSGAKRSEQDVSIFEKAALAAEAQKWWSDNSVSVTVSFDPFKEEEHVAEVLKIHEGSLKTVSFLPMLKAGAYPQMPYAPITADKHKEAALTLMPVDLSAIYEGQGLEAVGEAFCTTDACEVKDFVAAQ